MWNDFLTVMPCLNYDLKNYKPRLKIQLLGSKMSSNANDSLLRMVSPLKSKEELRVRTNRIKESFACSHLSSFSHAVNTCTQKHDRSLNVHCAFSYD